MVEVVWSFGVSVKYALLNMMISVVAFIVINSFYIIIAAVIIHLIGYIICFNEPRFVEIYSVYFDKCTKCTNKYYYGANSYYL
ncbi:MAG TPA: VirB3 family type IV secretion system protein [Candidatus Megaira endosymbiont of Hartmannula sinica]|nr:VirB3 family type IV secretion system protein [Candidatus Megaera endosymbiont of Hartmannula sinica]